MLHEILRRSNEILEKFVRPFQFLILITLDCRCTEFLCEDFSMYPPLVAVRHESEVPSKPNTREIECEFEPRQSSKSLQLSKHWHPGPVGRRLDFRSSGHRSCKADLSEYIADFSPNSAEAA